MTPVRMGSTISVAMRSRTGAVAACNMLCLGGGDSSEVADQLHRRAIFSNVA